MKKRHLHIPDTITTLELEEVKSEFQRSYLLLFLFSIIFVVALSNYLLLDKAVFDFYGGTSAFFMILFWIVGFLVYQGVILLYLRKRIREGKKASAKFKIIHTCIEMSFPSSITFFMMYRFGMLSFLDSPVITVYFLLIILSVLHLDFKVNFLTGVLAALQYAALIYYGFHYVNPSEEYHTLVPINSYYVRSIILILCGGAAAYVSNDLKKRIKIAYDSKQERDKLELLFGQHVSKEVSRALIDGKGASKRLEATVMFVDIRNFTGFADTHSADEVVDYQNKFFGPVIDIINQHQGVVLQILGDGAMACFGAPVENVLHTDMAFQASLQILKHVHRESDQGGAHPIRIGIGLHCGKMVAGNIGNEHRKQFSISGTPVIVASRIEQLNKKYNTQVLISGEVYQRITPGKVKIHFLGEEILKGIEKPVDVYQVEA